MKSKATLTTSGEPAPIKTPAKERGKASGYADTNFKDDLATDPEAGSLQLMKKRISRRQMKPTMKPTTNGHNYKEWKDFWSNKD
jgi:hypothetical protein